jgi:hypothetical protein
MRYLLFTRLDAIAAKLASNYALLSLNKNTRYYRKKLTENINFMRCGDINRLFLFAL